MAYYNPDRIERRNRRKAIVLTTVIYGGLLAFFLLRDDVQWASFAPDFVQEWMGEDGSVVEVSELVVAEGEIRP